MIPSKMLKTITDRTKKVFSNIGVSNGTAMPPSKNNRDAIAWELYQAQELSKLADTREKDARAACIKAGLMPDHTEEPYAPGTKMEIYSGDNVSITVEVNNISSPRFDSTKLKGVLLRHRIGSELADKIYQECLKDGPAPSHKFKAIPKVGE